MSTASLFHDPAGLGRTFVEGLATGRDLEELLVDGLEFLRRELKIPSLPCKTETERAQLAKAIADMELGVISSEVRTALAWGRTFYSNHPQLQARSERYDKLLVIANQHAD